MARRTLNGEPVPALSCCCVCLATVLSIVFCVCSSIVFYCLVI